MKKRVISLLLALTMLLGLLPTSVFAAAPMAAPAEYYVSFEDYTGAAFESRVVKVASESSRTTDIIGAALGNADGTSSLPGSQDDAWANDILNYPNNVKLHHPMGEFGVESTYYISGLKIGPGNTWVKNGPGMWFAAVDQDYSAYQYQKKQAAGKQVIRCLYSANQGQDIGAESYLNSKSVYLPIDKDALIKSLADNPTAEGYQSAFSVLMDPNADASAVQQAVDSLAAPAVPAERVVLDTAGPVTLKVGAALTVHASAEPADTTDPLCWSVTSGTDCVSVNAEGGTAVITAQAVGEAELTAAAGEASAVLRVIVPAVPAESISITPAENQKLRITDRVTLSAAVLPEDSTDAVRWSVTGDAVTVEQGVVTAKKKGSATVTATAGQQSASVVFTVSDLPIESIGDLSLRVGETGRIAVDPAAATEPVDRWEIAPAEIAEIDQTGVVTAKKAGTAAVTAHVGDRTLTAQVAVREQPSVEFVTKEGTVIRAENGVFTLNGLLEGKFVLREAVLDPYTGWSADEEYVDENGDRSTHYWIRSDGSYHPRRIGTIPAFVVTEDAGVLSFEIKNESCGVTALKTYINGQEVGPDAPYVVDGTVNGVTVLTKGLKDGAWIDLPNQILKFASASPQSGVRFNNGTIHMSHGSNAALSVALLEDPAVRTEFEVDTRHVPLTALEVRVPESFAIDQWNTLGGYYVGIQPHTGYQVIATPANASNKGVVWEALTPEIATHMEAFDNGIIPKRAGVAKFKITSVENPAVSDEISVRFYYKNPLTGLTLANDAIGLNVRGSEVLQLTYAPDNATEHRIRWIPDREGVAVIREEVTDNRQVRYVVVGEAPGTVTFTGKPYDDTAAALTLRVTVQDGDADTAPDRTAALQTARDDIAHGLSYLKTQPQNLYNTEWTGFTRLRAGETLSAADQTAWEEAVLAKLTSSQPLKPTDYARITLMLGALGYDASAFQGQNLIETLYNSRALQNDTSNALCFALIALDSRDFATPNNALWSRDRLIRALSEFQCSDGSFGLSRSDKTGSVDMTAMVLQALAPYRNDPRDTEKQVEAMFSRGLDYLRGQLTVSCGYLNEGGENACTAAQVLITLTAAGIDPLDPANGFTMGEKSLVSNLHQFRIENGFALLKGEAVATLKAGEQVTHALEAYRRFAEQENTLYDLTDVPLLSETPRGRLDALLEEAGALQQEGYTQESWQRLEEAKQKAEKTAQDPAASENALNTAAKELSAAIAGLQKKPGGGQPVEKTVTVTFRLIGAALSDEDVDIGAGRGTSRYQNWVQTRSYTLPEGSTVYDLFVEAMENAGLSYEGAESNYISSVTAPEIYGGHVLREFTNGPRSGWMFLTNGKHGGYGLKEQRLKNGDRIVWHYVNDYAFEVRDWAGSEAQGDSHTWVDFEALPDTAPKKPDAGGIAPEAMPEEKPTEQPVFTDVPEGAWYEEAVQYVSRRALMQGVGEGLFAPAAVTDRAMAVTLLWRLAGSPEVDALMQFQDAAAGQWYSEAVRWAAAEEITDGCGNGLFGVSDPVTREQLAVLLYRYTKKTNGKTEADSTALERFRDADEISSWAEDAMAWAVAKGVFRGSTAGQLNPRGRTSRAEMAAVLMNFCEMAA